MVKTALGLLLKRSSLAPKLLLFRERFVGSPIPPGWSGAWRGPSHSGTCGGPTLQCLWIANGMQTVKVTSQKVPGGRPLQDLGPVLLRLQ